MPRARSQAPSLLRPRTRRTRCAVRLPHAPPWSRGAQQENITQSSSSLIAFAPKSSSTTSATGEHGAAVPLSANPSRYLALAHNRKITATCTKMRHGSYSCAKDVGGAAGLICRDTKPKTNTSRLEHKPRPREPPKETGASAWHFAKQFSYYWRILVLSNIGHSGGWIVLF